MARVYQHYPGPDDCVGRVEDDGRVYGQRFGPDEYLGRVESSGKVYAHVAGGLDKYLGQVEDSGQIYAHVSGGRDEPVGRVEASGKIYIRRPGLSPDELVGRVEGEPLLRSGGAAFFLLLAGRDKAD
jgi:hypothetical protein